MVAAGSASGVEGPRQDPREGDEKLKRKAYTQEGCHVERHPRARKGFCFPMELLDHALEAHIPPPGLEPGSLG